MSVNFGLWRVDGPVPMRMAPSTIESEDRLERVIEHSLDVLGMGALLLVGRQVVTAFGKRIDMLALDDQGNLVIIELKRGVTPREVVAQALEYGFWAQQLSFEDLRDLYAKHNHGDDLESAFTECFELDMPETLNEDHQLVIVASSLDASTEQILDYLRKYGVPINVLFFQHFIDQQRQYLARSWMSDPTIEHASVSGHRKKQAVWNGNEFYVAIGESEHRNWDDMRRFGFVSAGHGEKYRNAMAKLFVGARVWAHLTGSGYVGVGKVLAESVPVDTFSVEVDGQSVPILAAPVAAAKMGEDVDNPSLTEYLVAVEWVEVRPRTEAFWEKGMFANQNVVTKLRQPFTLARLAEEFNLDGDGDQVD